MSHFYFHVQYFKSPKNVLQKKHFILAVLLEPQMFSFIMSTHRVDFNELLQQGLQTVRPVIRKSKDDDIAHKE